jgi:hypothetical protein
MGVKDVLDIQFLSGQLTNVMEIEPKEAAKEKEGQGDNDIQCIVPALSDDGAVSKGWG